MGLADVEASRADTGDGDLAALGDLLEPEIAAADGADASKGFAEKVDLDRAYGPPPRPW